MNKILIAIIIALLLLLAGIYWFIPGTLSVSAVIALPGTTTGANRALLQKENWQKFWTGEKKLTATPTLSDSDLFVQQNDTFRITKLLTNSFVIQISNGGSQTNSTLIILPINRDSIGLSWAYNTKTSANPITRIQLYQQAVNNKKIMDKELQSIKQFLRSNENIYGISIEQTTTRDTMLVSTYRILNQYPTTNAVYASVKKLQAYIDASHALQTGSPLLNVTQLDSQQYKVMVALPTNKKLDGQNDITFKKMIPGGFLTTTVTGGNAIIDNAYHQMQHYFQDYQRIAMAIPFQVLVTDRSKQTDTTKWITKWYFPVM